MLNRIAASTNTFIPVSMLLLDMLEMKELNSPPTGGVGKAVDLRAILKVIQGFYFIFLVSIELCSFIVDANLENFLFQVNKPTLKTRAFQEACVFSVVEELAEHLAQWSYSVAFFELSFIPLVRLRSFCKSTKVERFRKESRQLIRQVIDYSGDWICSTGYCSVSKCGMLGKKIKCSFYLSVLDVSEFIFYMLQRLCCT
jgi:nucleolar complex protein 2